MIDVEQRAASIARTWCRNPDDFYECQAAIEALCTDVRAEAIHDIRQEMLDAWLAPSG